MAEVDLRKLFVEHEVVLQKDSVPERGTLEFLPATTGTGVFFRKHPDDTVFIVAADGDSIMAIQKPRQVVLPLNVYQGDVEEAVQVRLQALLESAALQSQPVTVEQAVPALVAQLGDQTLRAIVASDAAQLRLPASDWDQAPFYSYDTLPDDILYGVMEPKRVGHIVTDLATGAVGIICIGGIVAVQLAPA